MCISILLEDYNALYYKNLYFILFFRICKTTQLRTSITQPNSVIFIVTKSVLKWVDDTFLITNYSRAWAKESAQSLRYEAVCETVLKTYSMVSIDWWINISEAGSSSSWPAASSSMPLNSVSFNSILPFSSPGLSDYKQIFLYYSNVSL